MKIETTELKPTTPFGEHQVIVTYHWENDGIGSYEYWGAKCFDSGTDYPEIDDIVPIFDDDVCVVGRQDVLEHIVRNFDECAEQVTEEIRQTDDLLKSEIKKGL